MNYTVKLFLLLLLCLPTIAFAELPAQVKADFAIVDGIVIMPINDKYMVDLDARNNLRIGDILTLVTPGRKVLHPVTRQVIGHAVSARPACSRLCARNTHSSKLAPALRCVNQSTQGIPQHRHRGPCLVRVFTQVTPPRTGPRHAVKQAEHVPCDSRQRRPCP